MSVKSKTLVQVSMVSATYTSLSLAIQVMGTMLSALIPFSVLIWLPLPFAGIGYLSVSGGLVIWAFVLFRTPMIGWWFVTNAPIHACVVGSQLTRDTLVLSRGPAPLPGFDPSSLREIGPGWHGKLPWEKIVCVINLQASIMIGNNPENGVPGLQVKSRNNIPFLFFWQTKLGALRGHLVNFVQYTMGSQILEFRTKFTNFLVGWARTKTDTEILDCLRPDNMKQLRKDFNLLLGGKDTIVEFEAERGMFSGDPQLIDIVQDPAYAAALQAPEKAERGAEASAKMLEPFKRLGMKDSLKKINPNLVMLLGQTSAGNLAGIEPLVLVGAENVDQNTLAASLALARDKRGKSEKKGK